MESCLLSLRVASISVTVAAIVGIPAGYLLGTRQYRGKRLTLNILTSLMAFPSVLVGLLVYIALSRSGPLGAFRLLYTPSAIAIGDFILAFPVVCALSAIFLGQADPRIRKTALALGASPTRAALLVMAEKRHALMGVVLVAFARAVTEVGSATIVGGNMAGYTRTMTTAITLETGRGNLSLALALGIILVMVAFFANLFFRVLSHVRSG